MSALNNIEKAESLLASSRRVIRNNDGISLEAAELISEAQAVATVALAEQQRIANKLSAGLVFQLGELTRVTAPEGYPRDPAVPSSMILTADEWKGLGL